MKKTVILKTGRTVASLQAAGEDFEDWIIAASGCDPERFVTVPVFSGAGLPDPGQVAAVVVTGSPAFVTDLEPWSEATGEFLRRAHAREVPILGICYGHQLLAHCLGGQVGFHPRGREIGTVQVSLYEQGRLDPLLNALPATFLAQVSHSQTVLRLPAEAVLLAGNEFEPHQAFRVGRCSWGVQFHPEFSARVTRAYIEERSLALEAEGLNPTVLVDQLRPTPESARLLASFMALVNQESRATSDSL